MKKLIVVAAVALAAVCSQAASMKWTLTGAASDVGLKVYLVSALSEFADESAVQSSVIGTGGNSGTFTSGRSVAAVGTVVGLDDGKAGQMQDFYYVIVSSDGYWASGKQSAEIYTTATTHTDSNINASTFKTGTATAWATGGGGGGGSGGVPEPTSGLLLLVGGAMLALRRK